MSRLLKRLKWGCATVLLCLDEGASLETVRSFTLATGISLAQEIANGGPVAVRAALSALAVMSEEAENAAYDSVLKTQDRVKALQRFGKNYAPVFIGKWKHYLYRGFEE